MNEERRDEKQVDAFRALAARLSDVQSSQRFEEALRRLVAPAPGKHLPAELAAPADLDKRPRV